MSHFESWYGHAQNMTNKSAVLLGMSSAYVIDTYKLYQEH